MTLRRILFGIVFVFSLFVPAISLAATLQVSISRATISVGDTFTAAVLVTSADEAMNAASGIISFPTDLVAVTGVSKISSVLNLWVQDPTYSNDDGTVSWSGVVPNPGYTGIGGQILAIQFRAKKVGVATIAFSSSAVLANDGNGTNILTSALPRTVTITATAPLSSPPPVPTPPPASTDNSVSTQIPVINTGGQPSPPVGLLWLMVNYLSLFLLGFALLALVLYLLWYLWHHFHEFRRRFPGSVDHAHRVLRDEFSELQDSLISEVLSLEGVRTRRELTREEDRVIANLKKLIKQTEFRVENELAKNMISG